MKPSLPFLIGTALLFGIGGGAIAQIVPGIPEPPLILHGTVTDIASNQSVMVSSVSWQVSDGTSNQVYNAASLPPTRIFTAGGQSFYLLQVPFDSRVVQNGAGQIVLSPAAGSLELKAASPTYTLSAVINGQVATIKAVNEVAQPPGTTSYSFNDYTPDTQGSMVRVDLAINQDPYVTWAAQYFANTTAPNAARTADPDGDGLTNEREFLAGTNPIVATKITITSVPAYGTNGTMQGVVTGVDFAAFRVAPYIQIEGLGWHTKPTLAAPTVAINPDGSFTANVTTGGIDDRATVFCAALVSAGYSPPVVSGKRRVPADLNYAVIDFKERHGRTLTFANRTWAVKSAPLPVGPGVGAGLNRFSDAASDVWVNGDGLHLTIKFHGGQWWSTEVILLDKLGGYGTYAFKTRSRTDIMDKHATFGMFTWDAYGDDETWSSYPEADLATTGNPHQREIDFEDSRWGTGSDPNTQAVVQPFGRPADNRHRYSLPDLSADPSLTRFFTWTHDAIDFVALAGDQSPTGYPPGSVFNSWTYVHSPATEHYVPVPGREHVHLNFWLNANSATPAPSDGQPIEVVISDFSFIPGPGRASIQFSASNYSVNENGTTATITATRSNANSGVVSVNYDTGNGTATEPADYAATGGTLTWADGDTADKTFTIPITSDTDYEGNETVILTLSSPTGGAAIGSPSIATLTIVDDDPMPVPEIVVEQPAGTGLTDGIGSVGFGNVSLGNAVNQTFTIRNTGTGNLTGLVVTKDGANPGGFTVNTTGMSTTLAPNASTTFTVMFGPTAPGSRNAAIHIASNDADENPFDIDLAGLGIASRSVAGTTAGKPTWRRPDQNGASPPVALSSSATAVPFEVVSFNVGTAGTYTLTSTASSPPAWDNFLLLYANTFSATAQLTNVLVGNDDFPGAGVSGFSVNLQAGTTYFAVSTGHGNSNAGAYSLVINGPGGIAVGPEISVEQPAGTDLADGAAATAFGVVNAGSTSGALTFTIRSVGTSSVSGLAVTKTGANAANFIVNTAGMSTTLAPGASTTFTVRFAPTSAGAKTAALRIASNDADENPFDIALTGTGFVPVPGALAIGGALFPVNEEAGAVSIPITRTGGTDGAVSVLISTSNGTATAGSDYTTVTNQVVNFASGDSATKNVPVMILNPVNTIELSEIFTVILSNGTGGATLGTQKTATVVILDSVDTTPPGAPAISAPLANAKFNVNPGGIVTVAGSATDNQRVAGVEASLDNGDTFTPAVVTLTGTSASFGKTATYTVNVMPVLGGANTVQVRSKDMRGNVSTLASRNFVVWRPLAVNIAGAGSVTTGFSPSSFREVGKSLAITATPKPPTTTPAFAGTIFTGWTLGGMDIANGNGTFTPQRIGLAVSALEKATLTFTFREGMTLTANFATNPFTALAGAYNGLVKSSPSLPAPNGTAPSNSTEGLLTAAVANTGAFSGALTIDGTVLSMAGAFDSNGMARFGTSRATTLAVARANKPSFVVALSIDLSPGRLKDKIGGTVTATSFQRSEILAVSNVTADRAFYDGLTGPTTVPDPYLTVTGAAASPIGRTDGKFSVVFPARDAVDQPAGFTVQDFPQGSGYGFLSITKAGLVTLTGGKLADGSGWTTTSTKLSKENKFPLFLQLYNKKGYLSGDVQLDSTQPESDLAAASLDWFRPFDSTSQYYPYGWEEVIHVGFQGARYAASFTPASSVLRKPDSADVDLIGDALSPADLDNGNARLSFLDGQLTEELSRAVSISTTNVVTRVPASDTTFALTLTAATGLFTGNFAHENDLGVPIPLTTPYEGVIYQKGTGAGGYGFFLTRKPNPIDYVGESGSVTLLGQP